MRFSIEKKELVRHIQHLATVVSSKTTSPIMLNYLLEVDAGTNSIKLTASDLELTAKVTFSASVGEGGMVAVNARYFNEIISNMPEALIDIWKNEEVLLIQCNKVKFNILCADASLYPLLPDPDLHDSSSINAELFMKMVAKTSFSVSTDVQRTVLTGVCWKILKDRHIMAATDGRKVAEFVIKAAPAPGSETAASEEAVLEYDERDYIERIIPVKTLHFLQRIHDSSEKEIHVSLQDAKIIFSYGQYVVVSNIIDQKYPEYRKAFIYDLPNTLTVDLEVFKTAIRRVSLVAPEEAQRIRFEIDAESFEINTSDRDTGDANEFIEGYTYQGSPTSIAFNFRFMLAILDVIDTDKVRISLGSGKDPMMIYNETDPENQQITFLLMPLRS
ncbi:MAG: DNA polymerase III subunit beta [Candidatus Cloacimonetes bacterium]|nr:DNA polymerase III subunit beta [Candidatus Cloacimonadota bacterium]